MKLFHTLETKRLAVQDTFAPVIGAPLTSYETAQLRYEDEDWSDWFNFPLRLKFGTDLIVSVAWSKFDDLWLSNDETTHFAMEGFERRWLPNSVPVLTPALNQKLRGTHLGRGSMTMGAHEMEIWTRLILEFDCGFIEVYNDLDVNGFYFQRNLPQGQLLRCV